MGKLILGGDGYIYVSNNKVEYNLLEGKSIGHDSTSDILFVMIREKYDDNEDPVVLEELVTWFYGAYMVEDKDPEIRENIISDLESSVREYEHCHPKVVEHFKKAYKEYMIKKVEDALTGDLKAIEEATGSADTKLMGRKRDELKELIEFMGSEFI